MMNFSTILCAVTIACLLIMPVSVSAINKTFAPTDNVVISQVYTSSTSPSTPFILWAASGYLGILLIILSFFKFPNGEEGLISILAWIPFAFAMFTSFAVEVVNGSGVVGGTGEYALIENHTIYSFDIVAILFFLALLFAIGNTYRIWSDQNKLREISQPNKPTEEQYV